VFGEKVGDSENTDLASEELEFDELDQKNDPITKNKKTSKNGNMSKISYFHQQFSSTIIDRTQF